VKTITKQILVSLVITVIVVLGGWSYIEQMRISRNDRENLQNTQRNIEKSLAYYLIDPVWNLNKSEIIDSVRYQFAEKSVMGIFVYDEDQKLYAGAIREKIGNDTVTNFDPNKPLHRQLLTQMQNPRTEIILKGEKKIGRLVIYFSDYFLNATLHERRINFLLRMAGLIFSLLFVQFFVLRLIAISPMKQLNEWANSIRQTGQLTPPPELNRCDEIKTLSNSFKDMATFLIESKNEVESYRSHLEELVKERTIELVKKTAQLELSLKELDSFSYSVSHDLRAPLRGIDGWSLALVEDYGPQLDEKAHSYLNRVRADTQRMGQLIDDLLMLSRISRTKIKSAEFNISELVEKITRRLREENTSREVNVKIEPDLMLLGDRGLMEIVLNNLLENAFKFTGKIQKASIEFGQTKINNENVFYVRDNGAGFKMENASKLFSAFQRLHKQSDFPGTGIGLATVNRIIMAHNGRIWAEANPDQGATFYFTLG
jgi:signal transduction histidine kinase